MRLMTDVMPEAPEALRHLNNNDSVTPLSPSRNAWSPKPVDGSSQ